VPIYCMKGSMLKQTLALGLLDLVFTKHEQARNIVTKPQREDIRILPANLIHAIRRTFVSNRIYEVACLVQVAIKVLRCSPCSYIFDSDINLFPFSSCSF